VKAVAEKIFLTSESVTEGHPDKMCDKISDAILDAILKQDPNARVACETSTKNGGVNVFGEITTKGYVDIPAIVRKTIKEIGYTKAEYGIEYETCSVWTQITEQSPDISQGINTGEGLYKEQGAGDQGLMYGFACNETKELMPLTIVLAHKLCMKLTEARKNNEISFLRPDGKSQVTVEYSKQGKPLRVDAVLVSTQHDGNVEYNKIKSEVIEKIIKPVCIDWIDENTRFYVNPTGSFVRGGPYADAGLTGRKIIVDTYGGIGRHGGGCFSGKDPSKVDRSAAYMARYIAKNIVASGIAEKCEIQLAYAIGYPEPVSLNVDCFGTAKIPEEKIAVLVRKHFPLKPADIVDYLKLKRPIYEKTAAYGHFGRNDPDFTWEKTDKADTLRSEAGL
jgi:S-adenosylmethionine synthetase